jgi:hypothetical protein
MERIKVEQLFVRHEIVKVLKDIKELNNSKMTEDIEAIENGEDIEKVLAPNREYAENLAFLQSIYKLLALCINNGVEEALTEFLNRVRETGGEDMYNELKQYTDEIIKMCNTYVELYNEGGVC